MTEIKKIEGFTPGPWNVRVIADVLFGRCLGNDEEDVRANSELIDYAPELYKIALEQQEEIVRLKQLLETQYINWWRDNGTERLSESLYQFKSANNL